MINMRNSVARRNIEKITHNARTAKIKLIQFSNSMSNFEIIFKIIFEILQAKATRVSEMKPFLSLRSKSTRFLHLSCPSSISLDRSWNVRRSFVIQLSSSRSSGDGSGLSEDFVSGDIEGVM